MRMFGRDAGVAVIREVERVAWSKNKGLVGWLDTLVRELGRASK